MANSPNVFRFIKDAISIAKVIVNVTDPAIILLFISELEKAKNIYKGIQLACLNEFCDHMLPLLNEILSHITVLQPVAPEDDDEQAQIETIKIKVQLAEVVDLDETLLDLSEEI